jgi:hypothetical protein
MEVREEQSSPHTQGDKIMKKATNRRAQTPKPAAMGAGSKMRMDMNLRGGDGFHDVKGYQRRPKHVNASWDY